MNRVVNDEIKPGRTPILFNKSQIVITSSNQMLFKLEYLCQLTEIGFEIYKLLADEIQQTPEEFLNKCTERLKRRNESLEFTVVLL
jgi:hypothetical protein